MPSFSSYSFLSYIIIAKITDPHPDGPTSPSRPLSFFSSRHYLYTEFVLEFSVPPFVALLEEHGRKILEKLVLIFVYVRKERDIM